jgi:hypothetical protein
MARMLEFDPAAASKTGFVAHRPSLGNPIKPRNYHNSALLLRPLVAGARVP